MAMNNKIFNTLSKNIELSCNCILIDRYYLLQILSLGSLILCQLLTPQHHFGAFPESPDRYVLSEHSVILLLA